MAQASRFWFGTLRLKLLSRIILASIGRLRNGILAFIEFYNSKLARPYKCSIRARFLLLEDLVKKRSSSGTKAWHCCSSIDHELIDHVVRSLSGILFRSGRAVGKANPRDAASIGLVVEAHILKRVYHQRLEAIEGFVRGGFIYTEGELANDN